MLVVGCGGDGMNVVQGARLCGAAQDHRRRHRAGKARLGEGVRRDPWRQRQGEALTRAVLELTGGVGVNHAFVCIDPPATLLPAFRATAKGGNVVVTALTPDTVTEIKIPPLELFVTQKAIMGAVYGFASPRLQIPELLALYRKGALKLRELITRTYRLDEINQGYADLEAGKNLRGVVVFDGQHAGTHAATWGIAALATFGVIVRPWNLPEYIWAVAGAAMLVLLDLLPWPDALAPPARAPTSISS